MYLHVMDLIFHEKPQGTDFLEKILSNFIEKLVKWRRIRQEMRKIRNKTQSIEETMINQ